ncbi:MAG TPA: DUF2255 family protein [Candidatus Limnocylindria bacterium]|nr:DUF2255 family protein [Candidatus Limnocylindria bacterium]
MTELLPGDALALLRDAREVSIETRSAPDVPPHRTTIWIVVDEQDRTFIRTFRGPGSRWYREALAGDSVGILVDGQRIEATVEHADDAERIEACSEAFRRKYRTSRASLAGMLVPEVLPTTLELHPAR